MAFICVYVVAFSSVPEKKIALNKGQGRKINQTLILRVLHKSARLKKKKMNKSTHALRLFLFSWGLVIFSTCEGLSLR